MTRPFRSTTHEERYYHVDNRATVFFRKEEGSWLGSLSLVHPKDQFSRKIGRNVARRKYFNGYKFYLTDNEPSYEAAVDLVDYHLEEMKHGGQ